MNTTSSTAQQPGLSKWSIKLGSENSTTIIAFSGRIRGPLPISERDRVLASVQSGGEVVLDFAEVDEISGAAMRRILMLVRYIRGLGGVVTARGASEQLRAIADASGFLELGQSDAPVPLLAAQRAPQTRIDSYPTHSCNDFDLRPGKPWPLGASVQRDGVNFAVYSRHATKCTLVLFEPDASEPYAEIPFPAEFRVGDVHAMTVFHLDPEEFEYGFRMDGPMEPRAGHRFDSNRILLDPEAHAVVWRSTWGERDQHALTPRGRVTADDFDWEDDRPLGLPFEDLMIYEMHVRGFTRHPSSSAKYPGTFAGLREKIPYLVELGVNCVELLPIFEFDETEVDRVDPSTGERLLNYWGYSSLVFCAPKAGYAVTGRCQSQTDELKSLIKELHRNGIEVILDVVFNHTSEGNENGPTLTYRGLDNSSYYMLTPEGYYYNFSGCGNTFNCNHPAVRNYVLNCLRYWVSDYHVDGFRFDLASILGRAPDGTPLANPPLLESLALDPVLGRTKLIAEAWDAGGLYQVGHFPAYGRWAEWNGKYRDCSRKFLKGDMGQVAEMAQRFTGSPDLYYHRGPTASINFVTCHDGFTLRDLVSYNEKHNEANGEQNRDGANDNHSWNCGYEGPSDDPGIEALRQRQMKNALAMLFVSQGVPMLLMGDEVGRSQLGNNNTYCQDNDLSWLDWRLKERNHGLFRFCQSLIEFRKSHPALRQPNFAGANQQNSNGPELSWHGTQPWCPDWSGTSRVLAFQSRLRRDPSDDIVYVAFNMYWDALPFCPPALDQGLKWHLFANTGSESPDDVFPNASGQELDNQDEFLVGGRAVAILFAR